MQSPRAPAHPPFKTDKSIQIPPWVELVVKMLQEAGHQAYVVGGALRDFLMKRASSDWDVATSASATEIEKIFQPMGHYSLKDMVVGVIIEGHKVEVVSFQTHQSQDILTDLSHRDFTVNAIAFDPIEGLLIDPFGGQRDISRRIIRAVGEPLERFREDPLRMLRGIRLACELCNPLEKRLFRIEQKTLKAMAQASGLISKVAPERIRDELLKILVSPKPSYGFDLMRKTGLLTLVLPELIEGYRKRQNRYHGLTIFRHVMETLDNVRAEEGLRLAALLHDIAKPRCRKKSPKGWTFLGHEKKGEEMARAIMGRLRFSNQLIERVSRLVRHHLVFYDATWSDAAVRRLIKRVGPDLVMDLIELRSADLRAHKPRAPHLASEAPMEELASRVRRMLNDKDLAIETSQLAIDGHLVMEVMEMGPGPEVGKILQLLLNMVMDRPELNNREDLVDILRRIRGERAKADFLDH